MPKCIYFIKAWLCMISSSNAADYVWYCSLISYYIIIGYIIIIIFVLWKYIFWNMQLIFVCEK